MTKQEVKAIREEAMKVLEAHFAAKDIEVKYGGGSFLDSAILKFEFVPEGGSDKKSSAFSQLAHMYGLEPEHLGKIFTSYDGKQYKITGLNPRASKMPVIAQGLFDNKSYKFPHALVATYLSSQ